LEKQDFEDFFKRTLLLITLSIYNVATIAAERASVVVGATHGLCIEDATFSI
jgi:hypothetical protein